MKLGHQADAGAAPVVEAAIKKETVPKVRHALAEALALIRLVNGDAAVRVLWPPNRSGRFTHPTPCPRCRSWRPTRAPRPWSGTPPGRHPADRALGPARAHGGDGVPGRLARLDPAADGAGPGHRVRADGRHQHGSRRADGAGRLQHVRGAECLPRALARALRRLLRGRAARVVRGGRAVGVVLERGVIRRLYGRPLETLLLTWGASLIIQQALRLWFGAANVDVSSPSVALGRLRAHDRAHAAVQPDLHHRAGRRERGRHVLAAVPHRRPACASGR